MNCAQRVLAAPRTGFAGAARIPTTAIVLTSILVFAAPAAGDLTLDFPSADSISGGPTGNGPLGEGGGAMHFFIGDDLTRAYTETGQTSTSASHWIFQMDDWTDEGIESSFSIQINGTEVGTFSFVGEGIHSTVRTFDLDFAHEDLAGSGPGGENFELRMVATSTVPLGGGSWNWIAGGEVTLYSIPAPGALATLGLLGLAGRRRRRL